MNKVNALYQHIEKTFGRNVPFDMDVCARELEIRDEIEWGSLLLELASHYPFATDEQALVAREATITIFNKLPKGLKIDGRSTDDIIHMYDEVCERFAHQFHVCRELEKQLTHSNIFNDPYVAVNSVCYHGSFCLELTGPSWYENEAREKVGYLPEGITIKYKSFNTGQIFIRE